MKMDGSHIMLEYDIRASMPDVAMIIDRYTADIHTGHARFERHELFLAAGKGVIDSQRHANLRNAIF